MSRTLNWTPEKRREISDYSKAHSIAAAAHHFGISESSVKCYRKEFGASGSNARREQDYTDAQKKTILAYVEKHSIKAAHRKFGPSASTISRWIHGKRKAEEDIGFYATSKARLHPAIEALRV